MIPSEALSRPRNHRWAGLVFVLLLALGAVVAVGVTHRSAGATTTRATVARSNASAATPADADPALDTAALSKIAVQAAQSAGGGQPTSVQAVTTSRSKLLDTEGDSDDSSVASDQVVVLQIHGNFKLYVGGASASQFSPATSLPQNMEVTPAIQGETLDPTGNPHQQVNVWENATTLTISLTPDLKQQLDMSAQGPGQRTVDLATLSSSVVDVPVS